MKPEIVERLALSIDSIIYVTHPPEEESPPPHLPDLPRQTVITNLVAPVHVPLGIPPINTEVVFGPDSFKGLVAEGTFDGLADSGSLDLSRVFIGAVVDETPVRISSPPLEYPSAMQRAGIEGVVVLRAIVDSTGRIERGSVEVIRSDNAAFDGSARQLIERSIFRPGRVRGQPVRVLIELPVQFRLIGRQP